MRVVRVLAREAGWAARRLARIPGFTSVAVLTVGVAVAPSLIFRWVDRAVLPPVPFERSHELLAVWQRVPWGKLATSYPKLRYLQDHSHATDVAIYKVVSLFAASAGSTVPLQVEAVTPNFFEVLRVRPLLGRVFREDENRSPLGHPLVILSERFWREHHNGRPDILGDKLVLNGVPFTVIGVMPADFGGLMTVQFRWAGARSVDVWIPAMMAPLGLVKDWATAKAMETPHSTIWVGVARLRPGHVAREARAEADLLGQEVEALWPQEKEKGVVPFDLIPLSQDSIDPKIAEAVFLLRLAGILVLVLGAIDLANMLLARGADRARTVSVQAVLGASRFGLACGAVFEALLIGITGAAVGLVLTRAALLGLGLVEPSILTTPFGVTLESAGFRIDGGLVLTALAFSIVAAVAAGAIPAWRTMRAEAFGMLRGGTGVIEGGLRRLRITRAGGLLVVVQVACALALTLPTTLLVRSLGRLVSADLGFRAEGVTAARLTLPVAEYPEWRASAFVEQALDRLRATPGVEGAGFVSGLPLSDRFFSSQVKATDGVGNGFLATVHVVSPEAFRTLRIPLAAGRDFGRQDQARSVPVAILSEDGLGLLADRDMGARLTVAALGRTVQLVGVSRSVPYRDLAKAQIPAIYLPLAQTPVADGDLVLRYTGAGTERATLLRQAITSLDPRLRLTAVEPLADAIDRARARFRAAAWLLGAAAALALFLAGIGTYGLLSALVARSIPEIGIRIALGAAPDAIRRQLAGAALVLTAAGLAVGVALGAWGATYLEGYLYGVRPMDAPSLLVALVVAAALALVAALQPARRASRVDPMTALRCD